MTALRRSRTLARCPEADVRIAREAAITSLSGPKAVPARAQEIDTRLLPDELR
jgi:hypothetical protein